MVSEYTVPPVPRIPKLLVQSSSGRCFTPVSSLSLPPKTTFDNSTKRRPTPSVRSSSKSSVKSSSSQGSSLRLSGSASGFSHRSKRPSFHSASSYDIKTLQFLRFEADRDSESMKEAGLLKNLMLKEPSSIALTEFAESEKQRATAAAKKRQRAGLSSVSSRQLPASVPKVNSKWDGMPSADAKRMTDGSTKSSAASVRTATSMQKSTASSIRTSKSQRDLGARFSETLSKFPACPPGVSDFLSVQSVDSQAKSLRRHSVGTSFTTASLPLSIEDDFKLRYPVEKFDLPDPDQRVDGVVVTSPSNPSSPPSSAQADIPKENFDPDMAEKGQFTRIMVRDSGGSADVAVVSGSPSRNRAATVGVTDDLDNRLPTNSILKLPNTSESGVDTMPLDWRRKAEGVEEPAKSSSKKILFRSWIKAFRGRLWAK